MSRRTITLLASLALCGAALLPRAVQAAVIDQSGARASGYAWGDFQIGCTTCPHMLITLDGPSSILVGGPGAQQAAFSTSLGPDRVASGIPDDYTLGGGVQMEATAKLVGGLATPLLGARAMAEAVQVFPQPAVNPVMVGIDLYSASVEAQVIQRYTFTGSTATTYDFQISLEGSLTDLRASAGASVAFYADNPEFIAAFGNVFVEGGDYNGPITTFAKDFIVSMTFEPGASWYMDTRLSTSVNGTYASGTSEADALHTLWVSNIGGGDPSLLVASLAATPTAPQNPVPEPSSLLLAAAGLAALGARRRRVV